MGNQKSMRCPVCQSHSKVISVVELYFALQESKSDFLSGFSFTKAKKIELYKFFAPPFVERQPIWRILHPDILIGIFVSVLILFTIFLFMENQPAYRNNLYLLGIIAFLYFFLRKRVINTYANNVKHRAKLREKTTQKADLWSSAYYCDQDEIVFTHEDKATYTPSEFFMQIHN